MITTVVIPAAGLGTRLEPASKAVAKELMPVFDTPAIHIAVREALDAGIERVVIVRSEDKSGIVTYLRRAMSDCFGAYRLREFELIDVIQHVPNGLGAAVLEAEGYICGDRFAVILPDGLFLGSSGGIGELMSAAEEIEGSIIGLKLATSEELSSSGAVAATKIGNNFYELKTITEKPSTDLASYDFMILGRYILGRSIFDAIRATGPGSTGEIELTDALATTIAAKQLFGTVLSNDFFDVGTPHGLLMASLKQASTLGFARD